MIGPTSPMLVWRGNQWWRRLVRIEVNSLPVKGLFLAQSVPLEAAYHHFLSPVCGAIVRKDQTLDKWGSWKPHCNASNTRTYTGSGWPTLSPPPNRLAPPEHKWLMEQGRKDCEPGTSSVLDPLARILAEETLWVCPCGTGKEDEGGVEGEKSRYRG